MTPAEQLKNLKAMQKKLNEEIAAAKLNIPTLKLEKNKRVQIGDKGTVNIYGLGKFPVCLYLSQLINLEQIVTSPEFKKFVSDNMSKLAVRTEE